MAQKKKEMAAQADDPKQPADQSPHIRKLIGRPHGRPHHFHFRSSTRATSGLPRLSLLRSAPEPGGKAAVCKTAMSGFDSRRRLRKSSGNYPSDSGR